MFFKQFFKRFYLFIFRERQKEGEKEGEKHQCVIASCTPPTGDLACNPGVCPDWASNQQPFGLQADPQSTEPHQPGLPFFSFFDLPTRSLFTFSWIGKPAGSPGSWSLGERPMYTAFSSSAFQSNHLGQFHL